MTAGPASGATHEAAQRSVGPSPSGSQIAPQEKPSVSPSALEHAVEQALGALGGGQVVGDRLLGEQQPVRLALGAAAARGLELALERLGDLARADRDGDPGLEALDHGGEVVAAHGARDRDERKVRVGEAHERERLAGGHRAGALAAEQDGVPAAVEQRGLEAVAAGRAPAVHGPARRLEGVRDRGGVRFGDVREQDSE